MKTTLFIIITLCMTSQAEAKVIKPNDKAVSIKTHKPTSKAVTMPIKRNAKQMKTIKRVIRKGK